MAVEADSYTTEAEVAQVTGVSDYTTSTVPTQAQVLIFMQNRAAEIYSWLAEEVGTDAPGPPNYSSSIDTSDDLGTALDRLCNMANAIGAAIDALEAAGTAQVPARSERIAELMAMYDGTGVEVGGGIKASLMALVKVYAAGTSPEAETHIEEGRVTVDSFTSRTQEGFIFDGSTEW